MASVPPAAITIATDKRKAERRPLFCRVRLRSGTQNFVGRSLDISKGGIAVIADANPALGQRYTLEFFLPMPDGHELPIALQSELVNIVLTKRGFRLGLCFIGADKKTLETLDHFLRGE